MSVRKRWVASFERLLDDGEKNHLSRYEKEFSIWIEELLPKFIGYDNINCLTFQRSNRILAVDVEFDHSGSLFPAHVPTLENWVVVQIKQLKSD